MKRLKIKRIISAILAVLMLVTVIPQTTVQVMAEHPGQIVVY